GLHLLEGNSVIKRSVVIGGHKTTISLENQFWSALKEIAQAQGATLAQTHRQPVAPTTSLMSSGVIGTGRGHPCLVVLRHVPELAP
ncbi:MAG: ribbon-helix-helix domain-containing protein, partial [Pseudolabrys sp.]